MEKSTTLEFKDLESGDTGCAIVRAVPGGIGLALSLKEDGDLEVFLSAQDVRLLIGALERTVRAMDT